MTTRYSSYQKRWLLDQNRGVDRGYVDAATVRTHIAALTAAGVKLTTISHLTGCSKSTIRAIAEGRTTGCQQGVARRVLAVTLTEILNAPLAPDCRVPAIGAQRRIRALQALGHTFDAIRAIAGTDVSQAVDKTTITAHTHRNVIRAYNALSMTRGTSQHNRTWAAKQGWPPPLAWDDDTIDDPTAQPFTPTPLPGKPVAAMEDVEFVIAAGEPWAVAATRLDTTVDALDRRLHRLGRHDLVARLTRNSEQWSTSTHRNQWSA